MQHTEANALKEKWGDKPCRHPQFEKEYNLTASTGKLVCSICGHEITKQKYPSPDISRDKK
jgi:hypothetical protein